MADFNLRLRGEFIDVKAPALCNPPKKRSASAPPWTDGKAVCNGPDKGSASGKNAWKSEYLTWLTKQAATLYCTEAHPNRLARRSSAAPKMDGSGAGLHATVQLKSEFAGSMRTQSNSQAGELGNSKHTQLMSSPNAFGQPKQMCVDSSPCMPDTRYDPPLGIPCPCPKNTVMNKFTENITTIEPITTLMLCDLPCRLSIHEVVNVMNLRGFSDAFDLIYMPMTKGLPKKQIRRRNLGYAFVNFNTPEHAIAFAEAFAVFSFLRGYSAKMCYTKPAARQGYEANWNEYSRKRKSVCGLSFRSTEPGQ